MYLRHLALSDKMQHPHKDCGPLKSVKMNKAHQNDQKAEKLKADFGCGLCKKEEKTVELSLIKTLLENTGISLNISNNIHISVCGGLSCRGLYELSENKEDWSASGAEVTEVFIKLFGGWCTEVDEIQPKFF